MITLRLRGFPLGYHLRDALARDAKVAADVDAAGSWLPLVTKTTCASDSLKWQPRLQARSSLSSCPSVPSPRT